MRTMEKIALVALLVDEIKDGEKTTEEGVFEQGSDRGEKDISSKFIYC